MNAPAAKPLVLGFMTVRKTVGDGYRGGYLLTNEYGRPIEFHYTSEVRFDRQQQLLHGTGFESYLYVDLVGKPMTDRQSTAPRIILVDHSKLLDLRTRIPAPVVCLQMNAADPATVTAPIVTTHADFGSDLAAFEKIKEKALANFDWLEPFERLEMALSEIRDPGSAAA